MIISNTIEHIIKELGDLCHYQGYYFKYEHNSVVGFEPAYFEATIQYFWYYITWTTPPALLRYFLNSVKSTIPKISLLLLFMFQQKALAEVSCVDRMGSWPL